MESKVEVKCIYSCNLSILDNEKVLKIRKPTVYDAGNIVNYLNSVGGESDNLLFGKDEFRLNVTEEAEYIVNINQDKDSLMLVGIIDEEIVSVAVLSTSKRQRIAHNADLSMSVKKSYWNNGIASEVMNQIINFAKENQTIKNISLGVREDNAYAIKLYEKFGFEKVGIHKNYFNVNGEFYDEILMDLCF